MAEVVSTATGEAWFPSNKVAHFAQGIFRYGVHKLSTVATNLVRYSHLDWRQFRNDSCFDSNFEQMPGVNEYARGTYLHLPLNATLFLTLPPPLNATILLTLPFPLPDSPLPYLCCSACTSASLEPSYVLRAIGADEDLAHSSIRYVHHSGRKSRARALHQVYITIVQPTHPTGSCVIHVAL